MQKLMGEELLEEIFQATIEFVPAGVIIIFIVNSSSSSCEQGQLQSIIIIITTDTQYFCTLAIYRLLWPFQ